MKMQRILAIIGVVLPVIGIALMMCSSLLQENRTALINAGLICNGLGIVIFFLVKKGMTKDQDSDDNTPAT